MRNPPVPKTGILGRWNRGTAQLLDDGLLRTVAVVLIAASVGNLVGGIVPGTSGPPVGVAAGIGYLVLVFLSAGPSKGGTDS